MEKCSVGKLGSGDMQGSEIRTWYVTNAERGCHREYIESVLDMELAQVAQVQGS